MASGVKEGVIFTCISNKKRCNYQWFVTSFSLEWWYMETGGIQPVCVFRTWEKPDGLFPCSGMLIVQTSPLQPQQTYWQPMGRVGNKNHVFYQVWHFEGLLPQHWVKIYVYTYIWFFPHRCKLLTHNGRFCSALVLPELLLLKQESTWGGPLTWAVQQVKLKNHKGPKIYE